MEHIHQAIRTSFPWLDRSEIERVSARLPIVQAGTGAEVMRAVASALDQLGLPPTSSLLLNIVGRGSKGTAVQIARDVARARFENAELARLGTAGEGRQVSTSMNESAIRELLHEFIAQQRAPVAGPADSEIVRLLRGLAGEVNWLKSTIDTERQLRRFQEGQSGGITSQQTPLQERRAIVSQLARSLETDRFGSQHREVDPADGAQE